jgi:hypothetical protein
MERATDQPPVQPGADAYLGRGQGPGADGNVRAGIEGGVEPLDLLDRRGAVRVGEENAAAASVHDAGADRVPFALVLGEADEAQLCEFAGEALDQRGGCIGAAVVHDDDFHVTPPVTEVAEIGAERGLEPVLLIVGGDDDGQIGLWAHGRLNSATDIPGGTSP